MAENKEKIENKHERPPIVAVMGHIDHGKSKLLDYIRKTNVVEEESGGITQHISAYEAVHKNKDGREKKITFLDTPGHEAFSEMRSHGSRVADIAILVVSAEDGVKQQTLEAYKSIKQAEIPFVVAITKIDKENANIERVKQDITKNEIYLEGLGGDIPYVPVSSITGEGVSDLLDMVLLLAELEELSGDSTAPAEGFVIETMVNPKKGISATLIIRNGVLKKGEFIVAGHATSPVRAIENFVGKTIDEASFSSPVLITGFDAPPKVGDVFKAYSTKKEALEIAKQGVVKKDSVYFIGNENAEVIIPVIIKADVQGLLDAIKKELSKVESESVALKVIHQGVGDITENDINVASGATNPLIIGFRVGADNKAAGASQKLEIPYHTFSIIYNITDFVEQEVKKRTPKKETAEIMGSAKVLRVFSKTKERQVVGCKMKEGSIGDGAKVKISRRDTEIGTGTIKELQQQKVAVKKVEEGEFGTMIESKTEIAQGDTLEAFVVVLK